MAIRLLLIATEDRPGEYVLIDEATRDILFGPFYSHANPAVAVADIARQLNIEDRTIPIEWR